MADIFLKLLPPIITAGMAYLVFRLGQRSATKKDKEKETKRIKDVRELFYISFLRFKSGVNDQVGITAKSIQKLETDIKNEKPDFVGFFYNYDASPLHLNEISKDDVFKFLVRNREDEKTKRIKLYTELYSGIEILQVYKNLADEFISKFSSKFTDNIKKIDAIRETINEEVLNEFHKAYNEKGEDTVINEFLIQAAYICNESIKNDDGTLELLYNNFFHPLFELCVKNIQEPLAQDYLKHCKKAKICFLSFYEIKKQSIDFLTEWNRNFSKCLKTLRKIEELEFKDFEFKEEIFRPEVPLKGHISSTHEIKL